MKNKHFSCFMIAIAAVSLFILIVTQMSFGAPSGDIEKVIEGLQKRYDKIKTLKMGFHQTLTSSVFKKVIREADGVIYYAKPGNIRWEYKAPEERLYLIDSEQFWDYDPKAKQVLKIPVKDALAGDIPQGFLFGAGNLRKDFQVTLITNPSPAPGAGTSIMLYPRDAMLRSAISNLVLVVNPTDYSVIASSFTDAQGNINNYTFTNIVVNPELDPELFRFKIPRGVKVILPVTESDLKKHQ